MTMENGTNGTSVDTSTVEASTTGTGKKRGRRKGVKPSLPTTGFVMVSAKLSVDVVRKLDATAGGSFRSRQNQIAYYIAQGLAADEP